MNRHRPGRHQGGASLVIALTLMLAITTLMMSVAKTRVTEQRFNANQWNRLSQGQAAEAGLDYAIGWLSREAYRVHWKPAAAGWETAPLTPPSLLSGLLAPRQRLTLRLARHRRAPGYVRVRARVERSRAPRQAVQIEQYVRPHSLLSPAGERAPPLVIFGSRLTSARRWETLFSISRDAFRALAAQERERGLAPARRRYWWVEAGDLNAGRWTRSIGSARRPVALVFPASLGCPGLGDATLIHGLVYYDGDCGGAGARLQATIYGTLAIRGDLDPFPARLRLLPAAGPAGVSPGLRFPTLHAPRLPGTWRDFTP